MPLTFDELPVVASDRIEARLHKPINRSVAPAEAGYFSDWTDTTAGPCATYASNHTEDGIQCGPSAMCLDETCCWRYASGAGNQAGWHKEAPGRGSTYYLHRPDACYRGTYDSWRWKFSDGQIYRCSDGWTCGLAGCFTSICPWVV